MRRIEPFFPLYSRHSQGLTTDGLSAGSSLSSGIDCAGAMLRPPMVCTRCSTTGSSLEIARHVRWQRPAADVARRKPDERLQRRGLMFNALAREGTPRRYIIIMYRQRHRIDKIFGGLKDWRAFILVMADAPTASCQQSASPPLLSSGCDEQVLSLGLRWSCSALFLKKGGVWHPSSDAPPSVTTNYWNTCIF